MPSNVHYRWLKHIQDKQERNDFEQSVLADHFVLSRLKAIIEEMDTEVQNDEASVNQFEDPNWAYKQAFRNGDKYRLKELKELVKHIN